jgi:hypothetical protein
MAGTVIAATSPPVAMSVITLQREALFMSPSVVDCHHPGGYSGETLNGGGGWQGGIRHGSVVGASATVSVSGRPVDCAASDRLRDARRFLHGDCTDAARAGRAGHS